MGIRARVSRPDMCNSPPAFVSDMMDLPWAEWRISFPSYCLYAMASHRTPATSRATTRRQSSAVRTAPTPLKSDQAHRPEDHGNRVIIVGVGASAGGLEAFTLLLRHVPVNTGMGFVLVQHLDPAHESALTQILAKATAMPVREAANNLPVEPNRVYIIPPNRNMTIARGRLKLTPRRQTAGANRSIDVFFESLAEDRRKRAIGVILSGTASDGTLGLAAIKAEGGLTLAQDESAKYDSMPRSAIAAGCVDLVLPPEQIAEELARIARHPYVVPGARTSPADGGAGAQEEAEKSDSALAVRGQGARPEEDGLKKISSSCATKAAWTSRSTNPAPSGGGSIGGWC